MTKGSRRCQWQRLGGYDPCHREAKGGAVLWSDTKGGALLCSEHLEQATRELVLRRMTVKDAVLWAARRLVKA
jgi:hypothetical protein